MKKPKQYIIIDDDRTNNLICEYAIKGYDPMAIIFSYDEPECALSAIREFSEWEAYSSTVLFVDVNMPTMSGWEFLTALEKLEDLITSKFTVFILSSSIEDFAKERIQYPYVVDFLSKPLSKTLLRELENQKKLSL